MKIKTNLQKVCYKFLCFARKKIVNKDDFFFFSAIGTQKKLHFVGLFSECEFTVTDIKRT